MTTFVLCNECGNRWKVCTRRGGGALGPPSPPLSHPWDPCPLQHPCPCPPPPPSPPGGAGVVPPPGAPGPIQHPHPMGSRLAPTQGVPRAPQNCPRWGLPLGCPHPTLGFSFAVLLTAPGGAGGDTARRGHGDGTWEVAAAPPLPVPWHWDPTSDPVLGGFAVEDPSEFQPLVLGAHWEHRNIQQEDWSELGCRRAGGSLGSRGWGAGGTLPHGCGVGKGPGFTPKPPISLP